MSSPREPETSKTPKKSSPWKERACPSQSGAPAGSTSLSPRRPKSRRLARPAPPRARSRPLGRQNPPAGAQPGLTVKAAAAAATRGLLLAPAPPDHAPPNTRLGGGGRGSGAPTSPPRAPKAGRVTEGSQRRLAQAAATLTCRRPRAWAAAAASLIVVALARRLRPPPPRSLSLPPPPGLMRDPRFLIRKTRPGKGAPEPPKFRRSSPAASACPHRGAAGPSCQGLQAASYSEEEPKKAPPPAAERARSAEVKRK
nr:translation initiation factor IF-2-like [Chlorocebus sabaeus]XP_008015563.2 translation initiation factor IF-2-like [Chlorocebus sabaeus]XP_037841232.1 translation initiation factor IF-2-like [Chlorocebus sabaeus]XP_037841233.1 translation initiation factor IF-2-like [Chlorocebus sabaeus]